MEFFLITKDYVKDNASAFLEILEGDSHEYWTEKEFLVDLNEKWETSVGVTDNSKLVGFIISSKKEFSYHVHKYFVHANYRSKGVGAELLKEYERILKNEKNANCITLKVYDDNQKGIAFYMRNNFVELSKEKELITLKKEI